jgi:hypothetical protein
MPPLVRLAGGGGVEKLATGPRTTVTKLEEEEAAMARGRKVRGLGWTRARSYWQANTRGMDSRAMQASQLMAVCWVDSGRGRRGLKGEALALCLAAGQSGSMPGSRPPGTQRRERVVVGVSCPSRMGMRGSLGTSQERQRAWQHPQLRACK